MKIKLLLAAIALVFSNLCRAQGGGGVKEPPAEKTYTIRGTREDMEMLLYVLKKTKAEWEVAHPVIAGVAAQLEQQDKPEPKPAPELDKPAKTKDK